MQGNLEVPPEAEALIIVIDGALSAWVSRFFVAQKFAVCRIDAGAANVREAVAQVQKQVQLPAFLLGHARGGSAALLAAEYVADLRGVIAWSALAHVEGEDIIGAASRLKVPLLAIHGATDDAPAAEDTRELVAAAKQSVHMRIDTESPRKLELAAAVTARFVAAYAEN